MPERIRIPTEDGFALAGRLHTARGASRGLVVVNAAMGVAQGYYAAFAAHLAERGFDALTWDYRGMGASRPAPAGRLGLMTWAAVDVEAALRWALARGGPVFVVGHSLGTQILGFAPSAPEVAAVVGVASQSGDWRNWPFPADVGVFLLARFVLPGVTALFGKVPRGLMGEEIPPGPILDWARWIRSRGYLLSEGDHVRPLFARLTCPMTGISIADDRYAPRRAVDALYRVYANARVDRVHLAPRDYGLRRIGHFGPFRRELGGALWPVLVGPLEAAVRASSRASD
jgi:predicted alpha/beta hydrolase